jgi:hypothetical protein
MGNLSLLAPDIVAAILDKTLPTGVALFEPAAGNPRVREQQRGRGGRNDEGS